MEIACPHCDTSVIAPDGVAVRDEPNPAVDNKMEAAL
jgi:hypothetical protein